MGEILIGDELAEIFVGCSCEWSVELSGFSGSFEIERIGSLCPNHRLRVGLDLPAGSV